MLLLKQSQSFANHHKKSWSPIKSSSSFAHGVCSGPEEESKDKRPLLRIRRRGRSLTEKILKEERDYNYSLSLCFHLRIILLVIYVFSLLYLCKTIKLEQLDWLKEILESDFMELSDLSTVTYGISDKIFHPPLVTLPSLNIFDYDKSIKFPVFPKAGFASGLARTDMPQLEFNSSSYQWQDFEELVYSHNGRIRLYERFDLRTAVPLQREISGAIIYNFLIDTIRNSYSDRNFFTSRIVLIKSDDRVQSNNGFRFDKGTYFILDGHHTTFAARTCLAAKPTSLRRGNLHKGTEMCGSHFDIKQDIYVIEGLSVMNVRELALLSGAEIGHGMVMLEEAVTISDIDTELNLL